MSTPLLATKLYIPTPRANVVPRPRLLVQLKQGLDRGLILLSAPAGFGKTTLLSTWIHQAGIPAAWVTLDHGDNDPARYLAYLLKALQTVTPGLRMANVETQPASQVDYSEATLIVLLNEIADETAKDFVLVLDDYHLLTSPGASKITNFLLAHRPPSLHLVLATRADPDLPLPRLRGGGDLLEIRQSDLRFTFAETTEFLRRTLGKALTKEDIAALTTRTEGWIAGLQMTALSLSGREDISRYVHDLTGSDRYILDYLLEEVIEQQSASQQTFLYQTSITSKLTASLCQALTGRPDAQEILADLERKNLFIQPLDDERVWYRYHQLFADLLQKRLTKLQSKNIPRLHKQASQWYATHNFPAEAIHHALSAGDFNQTADLVEQVAETSLMRSEWATLLAWLAALPEEILRARPLLGWYYAYLRIMFGDPLEVMETYWGDSSVAPDALAGHHAAHKAILALLRREVPQAVKYAEQAENYLPEDERFFRMMASWIKSAAAMLAGDFSGGAHTFEAVIQQCQAVGNTMGAAFVLCNMAQLQMNQGELFQAKEFYKRALDIAKDQAGDYLPIAGEAFFGLGELAYEWNQFEEALDLLEKGLFLAEKWGAFATVDGLLIKARIHREKNEWEAAYQTLLAAQQLASQSEFTALEKVRVEAHLAYHELRQGKPHGPLRWVQERGLVEFSKSSGRLKIDQLLAELDAVIAGDFLSEYPRRSLELLVLVRIMLWQRQVEEALAILDRLLTIAHSKGLFGREIQIQILIALAHQVRRDEAQALAALQRALALAKPEGYVRIFLDEGQPLQELLQQAVNQSIQPAYIHKLLGEFAGPTTAQIGGLVDPLSAREVEVLQFLPSRLTAAEIGAQLYVAESTIRTHIKHIYAKLQVNRRHEAVERAQELGLL